jgi:multidrug efflux pump subunit AcrB
LVTKNGILIVEFANQLREQGVPKREAILKASETRLRPILMTSLTIALGAMPIAIALGAASTSRIGMGVVIIGGTMFSLMLTLFIIPAIYMLWSREKKHRPEFDEPETLLKMETQLNE